MPIYQVAGKIFALSFVKNGQAHINLKREPTQAEVLRSLFTEISAGYHMHKERWHTLDLKPRNLSWITKVCATPGQRLAKVKNHEQPTRLPVIFNFH